MLAVEDRKLKRAEGVLEDVGQLDALAASIRPGYRTRDIAPAVRNEWRGRINEFIDNQQDLTSPHTLRNLSRLRSEFINDPNVQLIQQDFAAGNKEYDQLRRSRTFQTDYNPNLQDPRNIRSPLRQFKRDDVYRPYDPLTYTEDYESEIDADLAKVAIQKWTTEPEHYLVEGPGGIKERRTKQVRREFRGDKQFEQPIKELAEDILQGRTPYANYMKTQFGPDIPWTLEGVTDYLQDRSVLQRVDNRFPSESTRGLTQSELQGLQAGPGTITSRVHKRPPESMSLDIQEPAFVDKLKNLAFNIRIGRGHREIDAEVEQDKGFENLAAGMVPAGKLNPEMSDKEVRNAVEDYASEHMGEGTYEDIAVFGPEERKYMQQLYGGVETERGYLKYDVTPALLLDAKTVNLSDPMGDEITDKDKKNWTKKDKTITYKGTMGPDNPSGPAYNLVTATEGNEEVDFGVAPTQEIRDAHRLEWNLRAFNRNITNNTQSDDKIDKVESFKYYGSNPSTGLPMIVDRENRKEISYPGSYFTIVSRIDNRDYDDNGNPAIPGRYVIDVYKRDPEGQEPVSEFVAPPDAYYRNENGEQITPWRGAWELFEENYIPLYEQEFGKLKNE
jgi:hypothetical protein